jgi:hypothetical protein
VLILDAHLDLAMNAPNGTILLPIEEIRDRDNR